MFKDKILLLLRYRPQFTPPINRGSSCGRKIKRQQLLEAVNALPDEVLIELASFLNYLRYKSAHQRELTTNSSSFLLAVAALGNSGQQDVSERDEEILCNEIDPIYSWNLKPSERA